MKEIKSVLSDLTKLTKLATQGKWRACGQDCNTLCHCGQIWSVTEDKPVAKVFVSGKCEEEISHPKNWQDNARFIVAANPNNILKVINYVEQLQARIKELESDCGNFQLLQIENQRLKWLIANMMTDVEDVKGFEYAAKTST